ncbi:MAG: hypothetical protein RIQ93_2864 [Verrucomicrobiota bacterium]|jgi:3',5'-cyclic AMP phosphodiesterase CpdA
MKTIAHLSDLHFGTEIHAVADALMADLHAQSPSLLVVSGDLTQRARRSQFAAARDYLRRLPQPQLVVPGNHDIPLFDVGRRFLAPLTRYQRFIGEQVNPVYCDDELFVAGLNTARAFTWKSGRISTAQLQRLWENLWNVGDRLKIIVTHHPFIAPPRTAGIALVGRAAQAIPLLDACGVDLLLAGHLHQGYAGDIRTTYPQAQRAVISAQAGTAISGRTRGEANAYNLLQCDRDQIRIMVRAFQGGEFSALSEALFVHSSHGWEPSSRSAKGPVRASGD